MSTRTNRTHLIFAAVATFGLLVVTSAPAMAGGGRGFKARMRSVGHSISGSLSRTRARVSNRVRAGRSFIAEHGVKGVLKAGVDKAGQKITQGAKWVKKNPGKAAVGAVVLGLAVTNPVVGAAAAKAAPVVVAGAAKIGAAAAFVGKAGLALMSKPLIGGAVGGAVAGAKVSTYSHRARANGTSIGKEFVKDAKGLFGLKRLWNGRKSKAPSADSKQLELNFEQAQ